MLLRTLKGLVYLSMPFALILFLCEYAIYYAVLWQCHYPTLSLEPKDEPLRAMFLADTHLLGSRQGHWFDKLRREWQMHRAFQTAQTYFSPDLVVFLGDVFDEGKWCSQQEFDDYIQRFQSLFAVSKSTAVRVVAGNHDMGFHYAVTPYLNQRFENAFDIPTIEHFSIKNVQFVTVNSMAMNDDGCFLCSEARNQLEVVTKELECLEDKAKCEIDYDPDLTKFSPPILLQHFPLYRSSDAACNEPDEAPEGEKDKKFKENWDCVSKSSSDLLLNRLKPRLVLSGHTHHACKVTHGNSIPEWSISSFSWRNRNNPTFLLALITPDDFVLEKCFLPEENSVIRLYIALVIVSIVWKLRNKYIKRWR